MKSFYLPRWKMFVSDCVKKLKGEPSVEPNYFSFEQSWSNKADLYKPIMNITGDKQEKLINRALNY